MRTITHKCDWRTQEGIGFKTQNAILVLLWVRYIEEYGGWAAMQPQTARLS